MADYRIVRLQVQRGPVKVGTAPMRRYRPASIVPVDRVVAGPRGVHGLTADGEEILDVHHQDHPQSRDPKGRAGILFIGTGDYLALRERYGDHVVDGIAGETMLLDAPNGLARLSLPEVVTVSTAEGPLELRGVRAHQRQLPVELDLDAAVLLRRAQVRDRKGDHVEQVAPIGAGMNCSRLDPREVEKIGDQPGEAIGLLLDRFDQGRAVLGSGALLSQTRGRGPDRGQRRAQVM